MKPATVGAPTVRVLVARGVEPVWLALILIACSVLLYGEEFRTLAARWADTSGLSHGVVVAALVPVMVWWQRDRIRTDGDYRLFGTGAAVLAAAAMAVTRAASVDVGTWCLIPVNVFCAAWMAFGLRGALALLLPLGYFWLAVPAVDAMAPVLQWLTVKAVTVLLGALGVNALVHDSIVTVPAGTFEVQEGCSGIHYAVIALATGLLFAAVERLPWRRTLQVAVVALGFALVANWVRVATIVYVGEATQMRSSLVRAHYAFGWYVFAVTLLPLFWAAQRIASRRRENPLPLPSTSRVGLGAAVLSAGALLLAPVWTAVVAQIPSDPNPAPAMPPVAGWSGPAAPEGDWLPNFPGSRQAAATYRQGGTSIDVYVAVYGYQTAGRELVGYFSSLSGRGRWTQQGAEHVIDGDAVSRSRISERALQSDDGRERLVWSWYEVRGKRVLEPWRVKLLEGLHAFGLPQRSGVVAISTSCVMGCDRARATLAAAYRAGLQRLRTGGESP